MRLFRTNLTVFLAVALFTAPAFASHVRRAPTAGSAARRSARSAAKSTTKTPDKASNKTSRKATEKTSAKTSDEASDQASATKTSTAAKRRQSGKASGQAVSASAKPRSHGQQAIDSSRVMQIQEALVREHYLDAEPNGQWDSTTITAMQKYQADQGWQTKLMPDSRAIKKLGLGPDYSGAINARNSSSFVDPPPITTIPESQATGFTVASGVRQ